MKKLIKMAAVIAAMAMALSFVSCDDDDDDDSSGDGSKTTVETVTNEDGTTTTTTTTTNSDGSSVSNAVTTDEDGNTTSSTTTTTDSEGNETVTETKYSTDSAGNEVQETTATFSDDSTASTEKTVTSSTTATVTVNPSATGVIELVSADELEDHKSITLKVTECSEGSTSGMWLLLSSSANWDNKIEAFAEWDSDGSVVDDFEYTIDASTLVTWEVYFEGGLFISGNVDSLTIEYTISDTISGTAYNVEIDGKTGYGASWTKISDMDGVGDFQLIVEVPDDSHLVYLSNTGEGDVSEGEYVKYFTSSGDYTCRSIFNVDLDDTVWLCDATDDEYWYETDADEAFSEGLWIYSTSDEAIVWLGTRQ